MNAYGRYVHIFFGVVLMIPLLVVASQIEVLIVALMATIGLVSATLGMSLIIRGIIAPPLPPDTKSPEKVQSSTS